jgi:hypothetical protein
MEKAKLDLKRHFQGGLAFHHRIGQREVGIQNLFLSQRYHDFSKRQSNRWQLTQVARALRRTNNLMMKKELLT